MGKAVKVLKVISAIGLVIAIIISIIGVLAIMDAREFREKFPVEPNAFLLVDNGKILAGSRNLMREEPPMPISSEKIAVYQQLLDSRDYGKMIGTDYKLFLVHMSSFDDIPDDKKIGDTGFTKKQCIEALNTDARDWFIDYAIKNADVPEDYEQQAREQFESQAPSEDELRSTFFLILLSAASEHDGPLMIIKGFRKGDIEVYPMTMLFRFIKNVPEKGMALVERQIS